jgi:hypothetical protein
MIMLVEGERRARLAIREAQRNLDEWERRWSRADRALVANRVASSRVFPAHRAIASSAWA